MLVSLVGCFKEFLERSGAHMNYEKLRKHSAGEHSSEKAKN